MRPSQYLPELLIRRWEKEKNRLTLIIWTKPPKSNIYVYHKTQHRKEQFKPAQMITENLEIKEWGTYTNGLDTVHKAHNKTKIYNVTSQLRSTQPQVSGTLYRQNTGIIMSLRKGHEDSMSSLGPSKHFWNEGFLLRCLTISATCFFQLHAKSLALPFTPTHKQPDLEKCRASVTVQWSSSEQTKHAPLYVPLNRGCPWVTKSAIISMAAIWGRSSG